MFSSIKLVMVVMVLAVAGGGLYYVQKLKHENEVLKVNQVKLEESITEQQEVIAMQKESYEKIMVANTELTSKVKELNGAKAELQKKLADHDINFLAVQKPGLIERIVNKGTKDVLNDIENITAE
jgi:cytochrome oxidase Cu insertion factor (SCO1/SenC/PrrC family)